MQSDTWKMLGLFIGLFVIAFALVMTLVVEPTKKETGQGEIEVNTQTRLVAQNAFAWIPPAGGSGAIYLQIINPRKEDVLVAASTPIAERAELHMHVHNNGIMQMQEVGEIIIPTGSTVEFRPGGLHIMLFGLKEVPPVGTTFELKLRFKSRGTLKVPVVVRPLGG